MTGLLQDTKIDFTMDFTPIVLVGVGVMLIWLSIVSFIFYNLRSKILRISTNEKETSIIDILNKVVGKQNSLDKKIGVLEKDVEGLIFDSKFYIQKIGLVRFNPFNDTGGDQSFILALTNFDDSGVVISGLHTRNGTRWYAKKVVKGKGVEHELSEDELKAIKNASNKIKHE